MKKRSARIAISTVAVSSLIALGSIAPANAFSTYGWGATSTEWATQLGYTGDAWTWPCTNVNGTHALQAWLRFYAGSVGNRDTGRQYTYLSTGSCTKGTVSYGYWDDLNLDPGYKTKFTYGFNIAPWGSW